MNAQPQRIQEIKRRSTTNKNNYSTGISIKKQATMYLVHFVPAFWLFWLTFVSVQHNQLNSDGCFGAALTQRRQASATTTTTTTTTTLALLLAQDAGRSQMNSGAPTLAGYKMTAEAAADAPLAAAPTTGSNTVTATTAAAVATDNGNAAMKTTSKTITTFKTTATTIRTPTHNTSTPTVATTTAAGKQINAKHLKLSRNVADAQSFAYDFKENVARLFANDAPFSRQSTASSAPAAAAQHSNERRHIVPEKLQYTAEINVKQGRLMGIVRNFHASTGLRDVDQYLGLPYAEAPVGSRRFMPPGAPLSWQGLKIARHLPPVCPQQLPDISIQGSAKMSRGRFKHLTRLLPYLKNENEDCLYLNVYVPRQDAAVGPDRARPPYPVLVYVHGESFEWNSGNPYDGSVLASYGEAIVVTINYRLGVLGFLKPSIDENTVANFGLLDQIAALHWIKENIASFGGNKDSVTLMGHSTGAACVNYLMISPVASGLFHRAILMSGSAMSDWAATNHSLQLTMQIAHGLNCPLNDDNEEMLSCLRQKRYQDILKIPTSLPQFSTSLGPIVDGHVIPNQPYRVMGQYTEHFSRYDLLFGITESESYHTLGPAALDEGLRENERDNLLRFYMQTRFDVRPDLALAATLKKYEDMYNNPIKATNLEHRDVVLDILSDARVVGPLMQTGLFHADVNRRNYMYVFGHNSAAGPHASLPHSITGEELAFVFGAPLAPAGPFASSNYSAQEKLLAEAVMAYWTNFAKTGNPKAPWKGNFINLHALEWDRYDLDWPEFNKRSQAYMNIGIPPSIGYKYRQIYMNFWNKELPDELNQIASIQRQPFLHAQPYPGAQLPRGGTTPLAYPARRTGSEVITGHMSKFGTRDNGAEDPVRTLKLLLQEPYAYGVQMQVETAENMYNAPPTFGVAKQADDELFGVNTLPSNALPAGVPAVGSYGGSAIYGVSKSEQAEEGSGGSGSGAGNLDDGNKEEVAKSEATIQLLIGLIVVFIVLNVVIYSTFLLQKKKKATTMKRKLGGILSYDGATDDELKRSKQNDGDDSYIMDIVRKSNTYEAVKTERSPINGYKMARQLSSSTVDTHTKVCAWMSAAAAHAGAEPKKEQSSPKTSKKSSSPTFSSLHSSSAGGGGSFRKPPYKVNVAVDATPQARGSSVLCQEPIEVLKMKADGRNIIICQEVEVDDQELLTPQNSLDASRYSLARQHSTATEACEAELPPQELQQLSAAPKHAHSHSDPVDLLYYSQLCAADETVTSFMQANALPPDINVTSRDDDAAAAGAPDVSALTPAQQLLLIKSRNYPKVLPTSGTAATTAARAGDSPPMTLDLRTTNKRNSLPPNSFLPYFTSGRQLPPQPPPRTVSTLGRKPSLGRRNSNNITTSPLMLAQDCAEEEEEPPQITQNTLIVGPIVPKQRTGGGSLDANYSTLRRNEATSKAAAIEAAATSLNEAATIHADSTDGSNVADRKVLQRPPPTPTPAPAATTLLMGALSGSFQTFESRPASVGKSADIGDAHAPHTHHTEKVYAVAPTTLTATPTIMPAASARLCPTNLSALTPSTATTNTSASTSGLITTPPAAAAAGGGEQEIVVAGAPAGGGAGGGKCDIYAQPAKFAIKPNLTASKSGIPRIMAAATTATTAATMQPAAKTTHAAAIVGHQTALAAGPTTSATTASCSHASAMIAGNQVSAEITTTTTTTATAASTNVPATMATAATATGSRIPQLHRNLCAEAQQQQQQQQEQQPTMPNRDKSNANVATTTTTITTADGTSTTAATTTTALTTLTTPTVTKLTTGNPTISAIAAAAVTAARETTAVGLRDSAISSASTSSSSSTASSASASSSLASASAASSTGDSYSTSSSSSTSSSTGTVRTELQQK